MQLQILLAFEHALWVERLGDQGLGLLLPSVQFGP